MLINHGTIKIEAFESLQDLNAFRFNLYNKYLIIDSGIGSDVNAIYKRIGLAINKIDKKPKDAKVELRNMATAIDNVWNNVSPELLCFCAFIKKIDGRIITNKDLTETSILQINKQVIDSGLPMGKVWGFLEYVKKKFTMNSKRSSQRGRERATMREHTGT